MGVGAKLGCYGGPLESPSFVDLLADEAVTVAAGVPTVWIGVTDELAGRTGERLLPHLRHIGCGGNQPPRALIGRYEKDFDIPIIQAWGMTETSPLATMALPQARMSGWPTEEVLRARRPACRFPESR